MMYQYSTLSDGTGVAHSETYIKNGIETVKVYFEKPIFGGFKSAECYLPSYDWKNIEGFTKEEINNLQEYLESVANDITDPDRIHQTVTSLQQERQYWILFRYQQDLPTLESSP